METQKSYKDNVVSICQRLYDVVCVGLCNLSFDLVVRGGCCRSSTSEENIRERSIHGNTLYDMNMYPGLEEQRAIRTMMYDSIDPLTPMREPTVVNNGLSSMKPMNHQAPITLEHIVKRMKRINKPDLQQQGQNQSTHSVQ